MKPLVIGLTGMLLITSFQQKSKLDLVCRKWRQVGLKTFGKEYKPVGGTMAEVISLKKDGTFEEQIYGSIEIKGQWKFDADSSKLAFALTEMNGTPMPNLSLADTKPTDSIIRLVEDTLIYGSLAYYGPQKIYGHDDWYFVKDK